MFYELYGLLLVLAQKSSIFLSHFLPKFVSTSPQEGNKQARKLQATLEGCNPKLSLTYSLADGGEV